MKNIFIWGIVTLFCVSACNKPDCGCADPLPLDKGYELAFSISFKVKRTDVKYFRVTARNIDDLYPTPFIGKWVHIHVEPGERHHYSKFQYLDETIKRNEHAYEGSNFSDLTIPVEVTILGKDRLFELKIYKNDDLFHQKNITFRSNENKNPTHDRNKYTHKVEVSNEDYVISKEPELILEITDEDL